MLHTSIHCCELQQLKQKHKINNTIRNLQYIIRNNLTVSHESFLQRSSRELYCFPFTLKFIFTLASRWDFSKTLNTCLPVHSFTGCFRREEKEMSKLVLVRGEWIFLSLSLYVIINSITKFTLKIAGGGRFIFILLSLPANMAAHNWVMWPRSMKTSFWVRRYAPGLRGGGRNNKWIWEMWTNMKIFLMTNL